MNKKYTMKDIAQACGVSTATVSYVLNDVQTQSISAETKKRVLHFANMVGYVSSSSARALATGRTNTFGVYAPHPGNSGGKQRLIRALAEESERNGYRLNLLTDRCLRQQVTDVDAIFAVDISEKDFRVLGDNTFAPLLFLDGLVESSLFYCVTFDALAIRRRALAATGCKKAVLVCDKPNCREYAAYLVASFDRVLSPVEVLIAAFDDDTAVLLPLAGLPVSSGRPLVLGSQDLPLPFAAYAQTAVKTALKAISRDESPCEHRIRIS